MNIFIALLCVIVPVGVVALLVLAALTIRVVEAFRDPTRDGAHISASLEYFFKVTDPQQAAAAPVDDSLLQAVALDEFAALVRAQTLAEVLPNPQVLADAVRARLAERAGGWGLAVTGLRVRSLRPAEG